MCFRSWCGRMVHVSKARRGSPPRRFDGSSRVANRHRSVRPKESSRPRESARSDSRKGRCVPANREASDPPHEKGSRSRRDARRARLAACRTQPRMTNSSPTPMTLGQTSGSSERPSTPRGRSRRTWSRRANYRWSSRRTSAAGRSPPIARRLRGPRTAVECRGGWGMGFSTFLAAPKRSSRGPASPAGCRCSVFPTDTDGWGSVPRVRARWTSFPAGGPPCRGSRPESREDSARRTRYDSR